MEVSTGFDMRILAEEIIRQGLVNDEVDVIGVKQGAYKKTTPVSELIAELVDHPEVDYDSNAVLLHKICGQAIIRLESTLRISQNFPFWLDNTVDYLCPHL
ncbi:MAG: hypothetical protein IPP69_11450 [Flavobacteriales bacterium]|nr:hypothetical protein [Flavobacteriales bacterium]